MVAAQETQPLDNPNGIVALLRLDLDSSRRTPLYEQVATALTRGIRQGAIPAGAVLPPEPELARRLGISRRTVRQALSGLERQGLVIRRRGIGTFIAEPMIEQPLNGLYSFIRSLISQGREPGTRLLGTRVTVDDAASPFLTGQPDGLVLELTRLRLVDHVPLVFEEVYLPRALGEELPRERLTTEVLYDLVAELRGVHVTHAEETLQPINIARPQAALLEVTPGDAVFLVERRAFADRQPVELRRSLIRGDRYRFRVHLQGPDIDLP